MGWILSGLAGLLGEVVRLILWIIAFIGDVIVWGAAQGVLWLLNHTIFEPFTLSPRTELGATLLHVWLLAACVSSGIALVEIAYGVLSRMTQGAIGGMRSWGELFEGLMVWAAVLLGGWTALNLLLGVSNIATQAMVSGLHTMISQAWDPLHNPLISKNGNFVITAGLTAYLGTVLIAVTQPASGILLMGSVVWVIGVWLMRQVDIVVYSGILPIMAALGIGGNKQPFKWAWSEAMGAVFSQLAMVTVIWIGMTFITTGVHQHASIGAAIIDSLLAMSTFVVAARAPEMLAQITGHRYASSGHMLANIAGGYLLGRGMEAAFRRSPLGQALAATQGGAEHKARETLTRWGSGRSAASIIGQTLGGWAQTLGGHVREGLGALPGGGRVLAAADRARSGVRHAGSRVRGTASQVWQAVRDTPFVGEVAGGVATAVGTGAQHLGHAARYVVEPQRSLGQAAMQGWITSDDKGPGGAFRRSMTTAIQAGYHGIESTLESIDPKARTNPEAREQAMAVLSDRLGSPVRDNESGHPTVDWQPLAWQKGLFDLAQQQAQREQRIRDRHMRRSFIPDHPPAPSGGRHLS